MDLHDELSRLSASEAAERLLGCELTRNFSDGTSRVRIVETEAYDQTDAASHSYKGRTPRTDVMFGTAGHLYVYFTYGMHHCCNVVTGPEDKGEAVLIRAVEPMDGIDLLARNRQSSTDVSLTNGPAKLCQALKINQSLNGHDMAEAPLRLVMMPPLDAASIARTERIGISKAKDKQWRFIISGNRFLSR